MTEVYLAAGSNIEPKKNLRLALKELERTFGPLKCSRAYANAAFGFEGPDFINLAVGFTTELELPEVQRRLREIEALCGRAPGAPKWGSRAMDLDILLFGDIVCEGPGLTLPRPCLLKKAYILGPMAELAPDLRHPVAGRTLAELWNDFDRDAHPLRPVALD